MPNNADHDIASLAAHLQARPSVGGWIAINRDVMAASIGISRIQLARLLKKAESALGIQVEGDRVKFVEKSKITKKPRKHDFARLLAATTELIGQIQRK